MSSFTHTKFDTNLDKDKLKIKNILKIVTKQLIGLIDFHSFPHTTVCQWFPANVWLTNFFKDLPLCSEQRKSYRLGTN